MKNGPCIPVAKPSTTTNCTCPSGSKLSLVHKTDGTDAYVCQSCPPGQVITSSGSCGRCPDGKAAIPGIFIREWAKGPVSKLFKTECSGDSCNGVSSFICCHFCEISIFFCFCGFESPHKYARITVALAALFHS